MSARPRCETCGATTVRAQTVAGKGRYTCPSPTCPESFKKWYVRDSDTATTEGGS